MAVTLTVEDGTGVAGANAYVSVADVTTYHEGSTSANVIAWLALTTDQQKASIIAAARVIDSYFDWPGEKQFDTNDLQWPRTAVTNLCTKLDVADTYIPPNLRFANMELAIDMATTDTLRSTDINSILSSISVDSIKVSYDTKLRSSNGLLNTTVSNHVKTLLRCLGTYTASSSGKIKFSSLTTTSK